MGKLFLFFLIAPQELQLTGKRAKRLECRRNKSDLLRPRTGRAAVEDPPLFPTRRSHEAERKQQEAVAVVTKLPAWTFRRHMELWWAHSCAHKPSPFLAGSSLLLGRLFNR
nr:unnamed protein product [Digitaria exilis]